jgi:prevent-host-death family protein
MRIASVADMKARFSAYLKESENGPVVVTRNGRPVAVLLGIQDEDEIERLLLAHSPKFQAILEKSERQIRDGEWLSEEDFWRELDAEYTDPPASEDPRSKKRVTR